MQHHTPPPSPNSAPQCLHHALFMHILTPGWALVAPPCFAILSAIFTVCIRAWTPGVGDKKPKLGSKARTTTVAAGNEEATAIPGDLEGGDTPPPYESAREGEDEDGDVAGWRASDMIEKLTSAHLFVIGTGFLLLIIFSLFLSALSLQASIFCGGEPDSTTTQVIYWILFLIPCCWASTGLSCWLILFRNLWGPEMKRRVKLNESSVIMGVILVIFFPPAFLGVLVGGAMIEGVKWCQRKCCGIVEGEEEDLEMDVVGEGEGGSGENGAEERGGLMAKVDV